MRSEGIATTVPTTDDATTIQYIVYSTYVVDRREVASTKYRLDTTRWEYQSTNYKYEVYKDTKVEYSIEIRQYIVYSILYTVYNTYTI